MNPKTAICVTLIIVASVTASGSAIAQSVRHDIMDARSARADIIKLKAERRIARRQHNWGKVRQDNRLIANDRRFIHSDRHKVARAES